MSKFFNRNEILNLVFLFFPFFAIVIFWEELPEKIAMNYDWKNKPELFIDKWPGIFLIPTMNLIFYSLFTTLSKAKTIRDNSKLFGRSFEVMKQTIVTLITYVFYIIFANSVGYEISFGFAMMIGIAIGILIFGNNAEKFEKGNYLGVRIKSLENDNKIREKFNLFIRKLWTISSIIILLFAVLIDFEIYKYIFIGYMFVIQILPIVYIKKKE